MAPSRDFTPHGAGVSGLPGDAGRHDLQHVDIPGRDCWFGHRLLRGVSAPVPQIAAWKLLKRERSKTANQPDFATGMASIGTIPLHERAQLDFNLSSRRQDTVQLLIL